LRSINADAGIERQNTRVRRQITMVYVTYEIVRHDGGWAYKLGDTLSETYASQEAAVESAKSAAARQKVNIGDATVHERSQARNRPTGS
jgi:hypothetical protein